MLLYTQDQVVILASLVVKDSRASLANKVILETLALLVQQVRLVLLDHLDQWDLKAIRDLLVQLVNQDHLVQLVISALRVLLVCTANAITANNACAVFSFCVVMTYCHICIIVGKLQKNHISLLLQCNKS